MSGLRQHSRLLIPADGVKRGRRIVIRVDTKGGTTIQRSLINPSDDEMRQALDMATDGAEWLILQRIAQYAVEDAAVTPGFTRLDRALTELATLRARRSEP